MNIRDFWKRWKGKRVRVFGVNPGRANGTFSSDVGVVKKVWSVHGLPPSGWAIQVCGYTWTYVDDWQEDRAGRMSGRYHGGTESGILIMEEVKEEPGKESESSPRMSGIELATAALCGRCGHCHAPNMRCSDGKLAFKKIATNAAPKVKKCCGTCKWPSWEGKLTSTGRFKKDAIGNCKYPVPEPPKLPWAVKATMLFNPFEAKVGVCPGQGKDCECYELAEIFPGHEKP